MDLALEPAAASPAAVASGRRLHVALYYPWLYLTSGAERTILEVARRSRHRFTIFTNEYQPEATYPELREHDVRVLARVSVRRSLGAVARAAARILWQRPDLSGFDAVLVVCEGLGDLFVLRHARPPAFCLCLTPLRIVFDRHYRSHYLADRPALQRALVRLAGAAFAVVDRLAWRRYRRVFAISAEVRRRILDGGLAPSERLEVLHPGIALEKYVPAPAAERTFLVAGRIMWTKNLELALAAFARFRAGRADAGRWKLRIAGIVDRKSQPYLERLQALAAGQPVEFLVHPSDEALRAQYRRCYATLFTAFNEDWGLVMIESLASGKPVVAAARGGPLEIVRHERDGLLAEPEPEAFAAAMTRLADEPGLHARLARQAPEGAARFGWDPFVERLDQALLEALAPASGARR